MNFKEKVASLDFNEEIVSFNSDGYKLSGRLAYPNDAQVSPGVLFVHGSGAGRAGKLILKHWQDYLTRKGFSTFSFDCRGVGESEGNFEDSTLINRGEDTLQALSVFMSLGKVDKNRIAVIANSMGGHVAAKLLPDSNIKALVLYSAAAYGKEAEDKKLGEGSAFSRAIRQPESWKSSPIFEVLAQTNKPFQVIYQENDTVIPKEVKQAFRALLTDSQNAVTIANGTHISIAEKTDLDKKAMEKAFAASQKFLEKYL